MLELQVEQLEPCGWEDVVAMKDGVQAVLGGW